MTAWHQMPRTWDPGGLVIVDCEPNRISPGGSYDRRKLASRPKSGRVQASSRSADSRAEPDDRGAGQRGPIGGRRARVTGLRRRAWNAGPRLDVASAAVGR